MSVVRVNQIQDTSTNVAANISGGVVTFTNPPIGVTVPVPYRVLLETVNISENDNNKIIGSSSTITSAYDTYQVEINYIRSVVATQIHARAAFNGSPITGTVYDSSRLRNYSGSATISGFNYNTITYFPFAIGESVPAGSNAEYYCRSTVNIYNPLSTVMDKYFQFDSLYSDSAPFFGRQQVSGRIQSPSVLVNGLVIFTDNANGFKAGGTMKLYGVN